MKHTLFYATIFFLFVTCTPKNKNQNSILDLVPNNSTLVFKINDFEALKEAINSNEILNKLKSSRCYSKISDKIHPLVYLTDQKKGVMAFSALDSVSIDFIYITTDSLSFVDWDKNSNKTIETLNYENINIEKYQIDEEHFYTTYFENHTILSSSKTILENLMDASDSQATKNSLDRFYNVSNPEKVLNIWMDLEQGGYLMDQLIASDNKLPDFASWISLDLTLNDTEIVLTGIIQPNAKENHFLNLFNDTRPLSNKIYSLVPIEAQYVTSYSLDDFKLFSKNKGTNNLVVTAIDSLFNTVEEIGLAKIDDEKILFLRTFGTATLLDYVNEEKIATEEYGGNEIWELSPSTKIFDPIEALIGKTSFTYASIIENTFLFSQSKDLLQLVLNKYKNGDVFDKTNLFKSAENDLTSLSSMLTLSDFQGTVEILEESVSKTLSKTLGDSNLKNFVFGSQFIADDGFFHSNFLIKKITETAEDNTVTPAFQVQFNTDLATLPQFVTNHYSRKQELIVQDQENMLYLISNSGKILWKKQLEGTIQGKIQQVDLYKNGKLQLAFTTNNEFLILDRNGKEVEPFTMKFTGGNLNPLAVFDYEGKRDYRFLVTQNEKVFMYNNKGNIVKGFKYDTAEASIIEAPQHFRIGKKDYLIFKLDNGQLKILNRVGNTRVAVKDKFSFSENSTKLYQNKFTFTTAPGEIIQIDTKGTISQNNLNLAKDHGMDATSRTLAIMNDNVLRIRDKKVQLELGVYSKPTIFYLNDKIYVSVTDIQNQKIYLFDSQAVSIPDFPIFGSSIIDMADIDNDKKPDLVVQDQDNTLVVYKIN
jgi:hypothetical protein